MRWIAGCVMAGVVCFGLVTLLVKNYASQPSDPNLAEMGISTTVEDLVAPKEPEAISDFCSRVNAGGPEVENFGSGLTNPPVDSEVKPASFIDPNAAAHLDNTSYRWMPLCRDSEPAGLEGRTLRGKLSGSELMPRCDDDARPLSLPNFTPTPR
jgi:hypothetical protein